MKAFINIVLPAILALILSACSGSREFRIDVTADDIGTQNISVIYYADGAYHCENASAIDGKFTFTGKLADPTLVEMFTLTGSPLGSCIADGGDHLEVHFSPSNPDNNTVKGNKDSEILFDFLKANRQALTQRDVHSLNQAIDAVIRDNPKRFVSIVLLTNYFTVEGYENQALELFRLIPDKARRPDFSAYFEQLLSKSLASDTLAIRSVRAYTAAGDSAVNFSPRAARLNLLMLTDNECRQTDSIKKLLEVIRGGAPSTAQLRITDFGCDRDTMLWKSSIRTLPEEYPADVDRLWLVAGMATEGISQSAPSSIPYFILTDSTGRMLYRGSSTSATRAAFGRYRKLL